jgi:competence protein ComEA
MNLRHPSRSRDVQAAAAERLQALAERLDRDRAPARQPTVQRGDVPRGAEPAAEPMRAGRHAARTSGGSRGSAGARQTGHRVAVMAVVVAVAAVFAGWHVLRSTPETVPVEMSGGTWEAADAPPADRGSAEPSRPATTDATDVAADAGTASTVVVDVVGKVRRPGIVELPAGSRVVDALAAAGGAKPAADTSTLNLARVLLDGEQVVVGVGGATATAPETTSGSEGAELPAVVNVNTATAEELDTLPGVGPVTADAIIQWRSDNGGFASVEDLLDVSGIGDATLEELRPYVTV